MKGICFTEPLFHKVVKGEKTQTRRVATHQHFSYSELSNVKQGVYIHPAIPKYKVGEIVYLKEPYVKVSSGRIFRKYDKSDCSYLRFLGENPDAKGAWNNKFFMPESAARYFIEITAVRAKRLQDISDEDCIKECIEYAPMCILSWKDELTPAWANGINRYSTPQKAYAALINKINGKGTWEKNPFVWVYDFKLIQK